MDPSTEAAPAPGLDGLSGAPFENLRTQPALTARERQVLERLLAGFSGKAIGRRLGISVRTVAFHRSNLHAKYRAAFFDHDEERKP